MIYSPFHKILHHREKMIVRKMYYKDFIEDYIDFFGLQKINSVSELKE